MRSVSGFSSIDTQNQQPFDRKLWDLDAVSSYPHKRASWVLYMETFVEISQ